MVIRILAACAMLIAGLAAATADEIAGSEFKSGKWSGGAYTDEGVFSHCAMATDYQSGIRLHFAIDGTYHWRLGISHPGWNMTPDETIPITYQVDRNAPNGSDGRVISKDFLLAELVATDRVFDQFRRGKLLQIGAGDQNYSFVLTGTSRALSRALKCVERNLNYRDRPPPSAGVPSAGMTLDGAMPTIIPPQVPDASRREASDQPQAPAAPASSASPDRQPNLPQTASLELPDRSASERRTSTASTGPVLLDRPEQTLDAVRFMIRMFRSDDFAQYRFLDHTAAGSDDSRVGRSAAIAWTSPGGTGALKVFDPESAQPDGIISEAIADDARRCRGSFASGKKPSQEDAAISTAFTACKDGEVYESYRNYVAFRHGTGYLYLVSGDQSGSSSIDDGMPEMFARNIASLAE